MDLERIKQNLRLRSGRLKKTRKATRQSTPVPVVQSRAPDPPSTPTSIARPSSHPPTAATYSPIKEETSLRNWDKDIALPPIPLGDPARSPDHRPDQPPDPPRPATRSDLRSNHREEPSSIRYGRSGIERPQTGPVPEPAEDPRPGQRTMSETDTEAKLISDTSEALDFDLRPPPPRSKPPSVESLSETLFSEGHLNVLLHHPVYLARLTSFLAKYQPHSLTILLRFLETRKAIKAVEYANAVAEGIEPVPAVDDSSSFGPSTAATVNKAFEESNAAAFRFLADTALPAYITYNLVKMVSDCLIDEITGRNTPLLGDLVRGLSEVFCLTDPKQKDNPIIYASSEFYRFTGYGPDDVIGRNCRFLQGNKTKRESVSRLRSSIQKGDEVCETLLNYRRDGRPFINLLLIAPLHDDKGKVKYYIGAQLDVTGLVERGRGLDGFERYVVAREMEKRKREITGSTEKANPIRARKSKALAKLRELSETFDLEESAIVRSHSRSASKTREDDERSVGSGWKAPRRLLAESDTSSDGGEGNQAQGEDAAWELGQSGRFGSSGRLPGVYDSYMLIRPAPSLRIVFVSPKLRRRLSNVLQHPFLSHVAAPSTTLVGLKESFGTGVPVSAKIHFMLNRGERRDGTKISPDKKPDEAGQNRVCWISATPLLGSDDNIGVWMVVIVDKSKAFTIPRRENGERIVNEKSIDNSRGRPAMLSIPAPISPGEERRSQPGNMIEQDGPPEDKPIRPTKIEAVLDSRDNMQWPSSQMGNGFMQKSEKGWTNNHESQRAPKPQPSLADSHEEHSEVVPVNTNHTEDRPDSPAGSNDGSTRPELQDHDVEELQQAHMDGDSEREPDAPTSLEFDRALDHSLSGPKTREGRLTLDPPYINGAEDEANPFHGFSDDEDTPRRSQQLSRYESCSESPSRPGTSAMETSSTKSNGKHYMDYLLHPGSRPSSEYNRPMSGGGVLSSMYHTEGVDNNSGDDDDDLNDAQCARTPYSVD